MTATSTTLDLVAIKGRQQAAWSTGDYAVVGTTLAITGELLCEAIDLQAGERVLEVAEPRGADDRGGHARLVQQPRERDLRRWRAALARDLDEAIDDVITYEGGTGSARGRLRLAG